MEEKKIILTIDKNLLKKAEAKVKRMNYGSIHKYIIELIRRDANRKKSSSNSSSVLKAGNVLTMKRVLTTKGGKPFKI